MVKMLTHDHLCRLPTPALTDPAHQRAFVGIYVPTGVEWVGSLRNKPWHSAEEKEFYFQWRLNIATCLALLITLRSCLEQYVADIVHRAQLEAQLVDMLAESWLLSAAHIRTILDLEHALQDTEYRKQQQQTMRRVRGGVLSDLTIGAAFEMDLFSPLRRGMTVCERFVPFPETPTWFVCLDEAEFLDVDHHRAINSHMRAHSGNLFFKMTTMPYGHHTLETNLGDPLAVGHDFEYVYVDADPVTHALSGRPDAGSEFASALFTQRARIAPDFPPDLTLRTLLGPSPLLDQSAEGWSSSSANFALLRKHATPNTLRRAETLLPDTVKFMDQIGRKLHGALLLKEAVDTTHGASALSIYSGASMAVRCGDGNPRRLIRLFNRFLIALRSAPTVLPKTRLPVAETTQTRIFREFSRTTLARLQSEPDVGPELYQFLNHIGMYMQYCLHQQRLSTDQISSVRIKPDVESSVWSLVRKAVGLGLLYPNITVDTPDVMPERQGDFHIAYVLAPHFLLLPRRGKSRDLTTVLRFPGRIPSSSRSGPAGSDEFPFPDKDEIIEP
jgi:hypothetical protein